MAGHSKFKNIMHRKQSQDVKRAKIFTKIIRELTVSARDGDSPELNTKLRNAISLARSANMPKSTMERAIKRGFLSKDMNLFDSVHYEGYFSGGIAVIIEALTDNRNRTTSEVRSLFNKYNGNLVNNAVNFMFNRDGYIIYSVTDNSEDLFYDKALDSGVYDVTRYKSCLYKVLCKDSDLHKIEKFLISTDWHSKKASLVWNPIIHTDIDKDSLRSFFAFLEDINDNGDIQSMHSNFLISDL